jgi:hypothetical protein
MSSRQRVAARTVAAGVVVGVVALTAWAAADVGQIDEAMHSVAVGPGDGLEALYRAYLDAAFSLAIWAVVLWVVASAAGAVAWHLLVERRRGGSRLATLSAAAAAAGAVLLLAVDVGPQYAAAFVNEASWSWVLNVPGTATRLVAGAGVAGLVTVLVLALAEWRATRRRAAAEEPSVSEHAPAPA